MTATLPDRAALFLRRAGLLAGLLAITAGIVGMHILTGSHSAHMAGSSAAAQSHHPAIENAGHGGHGSQNSATTVTAALITSHDVAPTSGTFSCIAGDPCAGNAAMGASCIPSGSTGSLAAPPPSTVPFAVNTQAPEVVASSYGYLPESPSPADLCISRT